ncbi:uncharacterized protein LOC143024732 isoform X2 [Oratosquilla oratoria]|uniref:uncharacterized protein LOC143024732 isoform X2 n=1 Tax=Oratosquilla oratoria TaxID=337810 RepID=UPI003F770528
MLVSMPYAVLLVLLQGIWVESRSVQSLSDIVDSHSEALMKLGRYQMYTDKLWQWYQNDRQLDPSLERTIDQGGDGQQEVERQLERMQKQLDNLQAEQLFDIQRQMINLQKKVTSLQDKLEERDEQIPVLEEKVSSLEKRLQTKADSSLLRRLEQRVSRQTRDITQLRDSLNRRQEPEDIRAEITESTVRIQKLELQSAETLREVRSLQEENRLPPDALKKFATKAEFNDLFTAMGAIRDSADTSVKSLRKELQGEVDSLKTESADLRKERKNLKDSFQTLSTSMAEKVAAMKTDLKKEKEEEWTREYGASLRALQADVDTVVNQTLPKMWKSFEAVSGKMNHTLASTDAAMKDVQNIYKTADRLEVAQHSLRRGQESNRRELGDLRSEQEGLRDEQGRLRHRQETVQEQHQELKILLGKVEDDLRIRAQSSSFTSEEMDMISGNLTKVKELERNLSGAIMNILFPMEDKLVNINKTLNLHLEDQYMLDVDNRLSRLESWRRKEENNGKTNSLSSAIAILQRTTTNTVNRLERVEDQLNKVSQRALNETTLSDLLGLQSQVKELQESVKRKEVIRTEGEEILRNLDSSNTISAEDFRRMLESHGPSVNPRGPNGNQGNRGVPGRGGLQGPPGLSGNPGTAGYPGPQGSPGSPGERGNAGNSGRPGLRGSPGRPGSAGRPGISGNAGSPGPRGEPGGPGAPGLPGRPGDAGDAGDLGYGGGVGEAGRAGRPGGAGSQGGAGAPGTPGARGPAGGQGERGAAGAPGRPGARGPPGRAGERGLAGRPGGAGAPGRPEYAGSPGRPGVDWGSRPRRRISCRPVSEQATVEWCESACNHEPSYCPPEHCICG